MNTKSENLTAPNDPLAIQRRAIVVDMHADTTQRLVDEKVDLEHRLPDGHFDTVRAKEGGLDAQFFSIWVEPELFGGGGQRAIKRADEQIQAVHGLAEKHPETWEVATTAADIRRIAASGKIAALMGIEGGYAIDEKIENVGRYYQMGVRYLSPAWSVSTSWAGSSGDEAGKTRGLNDFGKQVIREMNRLGIMVDVSHLSDRAFWDIVNTSTRPVIATHSGCRAITDVPRNLTDDMIVALAKTGGVVNVIFYPEHIEPGYSEKKKKVDADIAQLVQRASDAEKGDAAHKKLARDRVRREEYLKRLPPVFVSRIVDHIDHIVKLVGIDHVGIRTGESFVCLRVRRNRSIDSFVSGLAIQPRGFREKICTASQPVSFATISDSCRPPLMGAWNPIRGLSGVALVVIRIRRRPYRARSAAPGGAASEAGARGLHSGNTIRRSARGREEPTGA